jgi:hypothetical protein
LIAAKKFYFTGPRKETGWKWRRRTGANVIKLFCP